MEFFKEDGKMCEEGRTVPFHPIPIPMGLSLPSRALAKYSSLERKKACSLWITRSSSLANEIHQSRAFECKMLCCVNNTNYRQMLNKQGAAVVLSHIKKAKAKGFPLRNQGRSKICSSNSDQAGPSNFSIDRLV